VEVQVLSSAPNDRFSRVIRDRQPLTHANQLGVAIGLLSISAFFIALVVAYSFRLADQHEWERFAVPRLLWLSTVLLAISSGILEAARYALRRARVGAYRVRVAATILVAMLFLFAQFASAAQMISQGVAAAANIHGSAFYMFMALHGLHLIGGMAWLGALYLKSAILLRGTETDLRIHRRLAAGASMYWHFMGVLWAVLFYFLLRWTR
jgi:cytochrome c oxidase subunit III